MNPCTPPAQRRHASRDRETDVCVLATVMAAIDLGLQVVLPTDALFSASDITHDALMTLYRQRFVHQGRNLFDGRGPGRMDAGTVMR